MRSLSVVYGAMCVAVLLALGWAGSAQAQGTIVGSHHDILFETGGSAVFGTGPVPANQICNFCHTPHHANTANEAPLWNRSDSVVTSWTMYDSPTMDQPAPGAPQGVSMGCLSCHDGATALDAGTGMTLTVGAQTSPTLTDLGTDPDLLIGSGGNMADDHPISIQYGLDPQLNPPIVVNGRNLIQTSGAEDLPLFGPSGDQVECGSCHDPHDPTNFGFLRISNNSGGSPLCLACHIK